MKNNVAPKALTGDSTFVVAVTPAYTRVGLGSVNLEHKFKFLEMKFTVVCVF